MSNPLENAQNLGQKLFEIQTSTITRLAELQRKNTERYLNMARSFGEKLPESQDPQALMNLQREMAESMWQGYQDSNQSASELVREAWEEVGEAYRDAITPGNDS